MKLKKTFIALALTTVLAACGNTDANNQTSSNTTSAASQTASSAESIEYQIMVQRATQTALWAMPAVGMVDFIKATRRDLGGDYNDVIYLTKPFASRHGFLTANDVTAYSWGTLTMKDGPLVVEVPAATDNISYFGTVVNAWDQPIEDVGPAGADKGKGGKYLFVPEDYEGELPKEGYIIRYVDTYEMGFSFRPKLKNGATDADAAEYAQLLKVYNLSEAANPPATRHIDAYASSYNCLPTYDHTFFEDINDVIQTNPIREQDKVMVNLLKTLGIKKGQEYAPTEIQKKAMEEGLALAYAEMQRYFTTPGVAMFPLWKGISDWQVWNFEPGQPQSGFPYETDTEVLVDARAGGSYFWITYLPKYLGSGTFYLTGLRDSDGNFYDGDSTYKLNVPADTPAKDFWSAIVYSMETKGFIQNQPAIGRSSRNIDEMKVNDDGSYDIYFGPNPPKGFEANTIPTGEDFFLIFRLYGPETKDFFKTWQLGDVVKVN
ncbi:DUF1214 domain-containing protein [Colwelliaceae bacterium BS250]